MNVSSTYTFTGTHSVADDPELSTPHTREWSWTVRVGGPLVGPGWVMKWEELLLCMTEVVPDDGDLNTWLFDGLDQADGNATSEKLLTAFMEDLRLPGGRKAVSAELSEASSSKWSVYWP